MNIDIYDCPSFADFYSKRGKLLGTTSASNEILMSSHVTIFNQTAAIYRTVYVTESGRIEIWLKGNFETPQINKP